MIFNITKNKVVCRDNKILKSIFSKAIGLMFHKRINDTGYVFVFDTPRRIDLHMFFVFFPIDLLFLDKEKKVIEIKKNFMPFSVYYSKEKANYVLELPIGKTEDVSLGDSIDFKS